ncbi:MAG: 5-formyltetrahydrofolate cyclo-ligase [Gulosibacter sp.]|uniref:5-formyltetrahydrofolate cyclo-ligase n=1 Tax=Gulosibacter sp. TaxID=2817531 RepID=UPI003F93F784
MDETIAAEKRRLRALVRESRSQRTPAEITRMAEPVAAFMTDLVEEVGARRVACFLSSPVEVPTHTFLEQAKSAGIEVLLPAARPHGQLDWVVDTGAARMHPSLQVPEPIGVALPGSPLADIDLIFVPAALVDRNGYRLGWGGGFYDRALAGLDTLVIAIVHENEIVDSVPVEDHDQPVPGVITPARILSFGKWSQE